MPAVVSRTDGSYEDGTSEPDDTSWWSRSWKNSRNAARISFEVRGAMVRPILGCDGAVTDDSVTGQQARDLPRRDPEGVVFQADREFVCDPAPVTRRPAGAASSGSAA